MLTIALINQAATLNNYSTVGVVDYIANLPFKINFQIGDEETGNRIMPTVSAKCICIFQQRDATLGNITKNATSMFNPQDMSMWTVPLTAADSTNIVGSNFQVFVDFNGDSTLPDLSDASLLLSGMAYNAVEKTTFDGEC